MRPLRWMIAAILRVIDRIVRAWKARDSSLAAAPGTPTVVRAAALRQLSEVVGSATRSFPPADEVLVYFNYALSPFYAELPPKRVQAVVDAGRDEQRPLATGVNVRMAIGISAGDRTGTAPFARYAVGIAASEAGTFTELSFASRAAGRSDVTLSKLGRRRPIPDHELRALVISYDVRADTLTMSAGDITRTIRRFRAQLDRRGIADEFTIDLSADSTGISADRIAMFDNFSVSGAVSQ